MTNKLLLEYLRLGGISQQTVIETLDITYDEWVELTKYQYTLNSSQIALLAKLFEDSEANIRFLTKSPKTQSKKLSDRFHIKTLKVLCTDKIIGTREG
mgnify:CR=1 FL=1